MINKVVLDCVVITLLMFGYNIFLVLLELEKLEVVLYFGERLLVLCLVGINFCFTAFHFFKELE